MAKKQAMPCLVVKTFEDSWCPFHGLLSTAQTKIPTKMDSKNPNSRAFDGLCSKYSQFQKSLKQYIETIQKFLALKKSLSALIFKFWRIGDSNS